MLKKDETNRLMKLSAYASDKWIMGRTILELYAKLEKAEKEIDAWRNDALLMSDKHRAEKAEAELADAKAGNNLKAALKWPDDLCKSTPKVGKILEDL